jgi:DNA ligase (NAD+)
MHDLFHGTPFVDQKVEIFKANMIIPQVYDAEDLSDFLHYPELPFIDIPNKCPICGGEVQQHTENDSTVLICMNPNCDGKLINKIDHYCGKKGLDIKGLSKMTISKLIDNGWLGNYEELYSLSNFRDEWIKMPGFGERSVDKILNAIESSRECELERFIAALGIPLIGTSASKELVKYFDTWEKFYEAATGKFDFYNLPNFGVEMYSSIVNFDYEEANRIAQHYLQFKTVEEKQILNDLTGLVFVITGKLHNYKNRAELTNEITSRGGKVASSISGKTNYLINNDINSTSSKNKTAQQMNIPIITEEQFGELIGNI